MVRFYSVDRYGCVHFGHTPAEAAKKAREAESDGGFGLDDLEIGIGVELEAAAEKEEEKN